MNEPRATLRPPISGRVRPRLVVRLADVRLADGRRLRYVGPQPFPDRVVDGVAHRWHGPQQMIVLVTEDLTRHGVLLHVSVSYQKRDPSWTDIKLVKRAFFGDDDDAMVLLPKERDFIHGVPGAPGELDSHVFHMSQLPVDWDIQ